MPKQYLPEFKNQVALSIQNGLPVPEASRKYQISPSTLYRWMKEIALTNGQAFPTNYTTLERKIQRLEHILQIIRCRFVNDVLQSRESK